MYSLEAGVPIPETKTGHHRMRYPFKEMAVGDSFFVPFGDEDKPSSLLRRLCSAAGSASFRLDWHPTFIARTVDGGVRVWRTN